MDLCVPLASSSWIVLEGFSSNSNHALYSADTFLWFFVSDYARTCMKALEVGEPRPMRH